MHRDLAKNLEGSFLRVSLISRYILISYVNAHEIDYSMIFHYIGRQGAKILYGRAYLDVYTVDEKKLRQLFREKFAREVRGAVTTALQCLERSKVLSYIAKLKDECVEAFKLCPLCQDLVSYIDQLNDMYNRGQLSMRLSEASILFPEPKSSFSHNEILYLLTVLFPELLKLRYKDVDLHSYIVNNFEGLRKEMSKAYRDKPMVFRLLYLSLDKLGIKPEDLMLYIYGSLIKYRIPLEIFFKALELAYWKYVADIYKKSGRVVQTVALQDILPYLEQILRSQGYLLPPLSELFAMVKRIEILEISEYGSSSMHVGLPDYRGKEVPIPIIFYRPKNVAISEIEAGGIPLSVLRKYWKLD